MVLLKIRLEEKKELQHTLLRPIPDEGLRTETFYLSSLADGYYLLPVFKNLKVNMSL